MAVLIASDISKDVAGNPLFQGVSFKLERRERMTLSGRNGAGKTTLLRTLSGDTPIDGGELVWAKGTKVSLHDQRPPRDTGMSLRDYVLTGCAELLEIEARMAALEQAMADGDVSEKVLDAYSRAQGELEHSGGYGWREQVLGTMRGLGLRDADMDRELSTFSGGELTRASLARALAGAPDLLLLDEPTNHLDIASLEWLENHLQQLDAAVVLVAHDRWFLEAVGTAVLELEGGRGRFFPGTWHQWRREQAAREMALGRSIEKQQAQIDRLERFVNRFSAGTRSKQAQSRARQLDKIEKIEVGPKDGKSLGFDFKEPERAGRVIFELKDGTVSVAGRKLLDHADMHLERGEHVSIVGPNGAGKSTLLSVLIGEKELDAGKLSTGYNVKFGLLSQHAHELGEAGTVVEACGRATGLPPNKARALLGRFLFSGEQAEKQVSDLSGGERQRLSLAILVSSGANVLVLDEPTNHLDVESREALEDALSAFPGTVLLISHDRALLDAVGSRTVSFEDGRLRSYVGGWAEYLRVRDEEKAEQAAAKAAGRASDRGGIRTGSASARADAATAAGTAGGGKASPGRGASAPASAGPGSKERAGGNGSSRSAGKPGAKNGTGAPHVKGAGTGRAAKEAKRLEREIEQAEAKLREVEQELADSAAWTDPSRASESTARHQQAREALEALYSRWETVAG